MPRLPPRPVAEESMGVGPRHQYLRPRTKDSSPWQQQLFVELDEAAAVSICLLAW